MRVRLFFIGLLLSIMNSCLSNNSIPTNIHFDDSIVVDNNYRIVAYFDAQGCASCRIKELSRWKWLMKNASKDSLPVSFIYILNADSSDTEVRQNIALLKFTHPIIFDPIGNFERDNNLPEDPNKHIFLVDSKGSVLMSGSPIFYPMIWEAYKKRIRSIGTPTSK